jgi:hypothetical protein
MKKIMILTILLIFSVMLFGIDKQTANNIKDETEIQILLLLYNTADEMKAELSRGVLPDLVFSPIYWLKKTKQWKDIFDYYRTDEYDGLMDKSVNDVGNYQRLTLAQAKIAFFTMGYFVLFYQNFLGG